MALPPASPCRKCAPVANARYVMSCMWRSRGLHRAVSERRASGSDPRRMQAAAVSCRLAATPCTWVLNTATEQWRASGSVWRRMPAIPAVRAVLKWCDSRGY
eukprot:360025-Chlamydomonas_euryale.AAC.6